jgi:hypothetical protein
MPEEEGLHHAHMTHRCCTEQCRSHLAGGTRGREGALTTGQAKASYLPVMSNVKVVTGHKTSSTTVQLAPTSSAPGTLGCAPASNSMSTANSCPLSAAFLRAVHPACRAGARNQGGIWSHAEAGHATEAAPSPPRRARSSSPADPGHKESRTSRYKLRRSRVAAPRAAPEGSRALCLTSEFQ